MSSVVASINGTLDVFIGMDVSVESGVLVFELLLLFRLLLGLEGVAPRLELVSVVVVLVDGGILLLFGMLLLFSIPGILINVPREFLDIK